MPVSTWASCLRWAAAWRPGRSTGPTAAALTCGARGMAARPTSTAWLRSPWCPGPTASAAAGSSMRGTSIRCSPTAQANRTPSTATAGCSPGACASPRPTPWRWPCTRTASRAIPTTTNACRPSAWCRAGWTRACRCAISAPSRCPTGWACIPGSRARRTHASPPPCRACGSAAAIRCPRATPSGSPRAGTSMAAYRPTAT